MTSTSQETEAGSTGLYLTESDVSALVSMNDAVAALESLLPQEVQGKAANLTKSLGTWESRSSANALGAFSTADGMALWKTWVNTPNGATATASLFSTVDGSLLAILEAITLGALRTAAISGLATRWMAPEGADELALIGTGRQALAQIAAINVACPLRRVRIFSPTPENRSRFAERAKAEFSFEVIESDSVEACVADAPVVTLLTRASDPFLAVGALSPETHLNAVGAVLPANAEMAPDVLAAASLVAVDNLTNVRNTSREFQEHYGSDEEGWAQIKTLGEVIAAGPGQRPGGPSVFKSAGMGLSDLAIASAAYRAARQQGLGRPLEQPSIQTPRWTA